MSAPSARPIRALLLLVGYFAPVPPKKAFGLWMSEYGYDNWNEIDTTLAGLRTNKFPTDGVMLDGFAST